MQADFLTAGLQGPFDVALALGYFDYIEDAGAHLRRIGELTSGGRSSRASRAGRGRRARCGSFATRSINNCPIFDYTEDGLRKLLADAGFARTEIKPGKSGFLVRADK